MTTLSLRRTRPTLRRTDTRSVNGRNGSGVRALREHLGVTQRLLARLLSVSERRLIALEGGEPVSESARRRCAEVERLRAALARVMRKDAIARWLQEPNKAFGGLKPVEVIERGQIDRIWEMVFHLRAGTVA